MCVQATRSTGLCSLTYISVYAGNPDYSILFTCIHLCTGNLDSLPPNRWPTTHPEPRRSSFTQDFSVGALLWTGVYT